MTKYNNIEKAEETRGKRIFELWKSDAETPSV
jgi:hypothetical protein